MNLSIVILAAGQGTRMRSARPKVLHSLAGQPLLARVVDTATQLGPRNIIVVYGHGGDMLRETLGNLPVHWVEQAARLGTGHALLQAMPQVPDDATVLVLYGDVPLITADTLRRLFDAAQHNALALLTAHLADPYGYGRILRDSDGNVTRIVEEKDATEHERRINEVNTGFLAAPASLMRRWLSRLDNKNAQGEYYLTDVIAMAVAEGITVHTATPSREAEILGVNNRVQLADLERRFQAWQSEQLMMAGVTLMDPARFDLRGELQVGTDVTIDINVIVEGSVKLGNGVRVGPNTVIKNAEIGDNVQIFANCVIENAVIGAGGRIGPFARIRPDTVLAENVHIGNFVEVKKANIARNSKVNHLSYIGDTMMGADVNIGAGTITCNYDGANKHVTYIGDRVFVGSDTQLVAPVRIGNDATIGAGTTVTKDVPENVLCISRVPQTARPGWRRPQKKPKPPSA